MSAVVPRSQPLTASRRRKRARASPDYRGSRDVCQRPRNGKAAPRSIGQIWEPCCFGLSGDKTGRASAIGSHGDLKKSAVETHPIPPDESFTSISSASCYSRRSNSVFIFSPRAVPQLLPSLSLSFVGSGWMRTVCCRPTLASPLT